MDIEWATIVEEVRARKGAEPGYTDLIGVLRDALVVDDLPQEIQVEVAVVIESTYEEMRRGGVVTLRYTVVGPDDEPVYFGSTDYATTSQSDVLPDDPRRGVVPLKVTMPLATHGVYIIGCGLRWADLDLDGERLTVRHTITTVDHKPVEGGVKTPRSRRAIDLDAGTVTALRTQRKAQLEQRMLMGSGYTDRGLVFAMPDGAAWNPDTIGQAFERAVDRSGLRRIVLHGLRHSHATHLLAAGVNPKVVSERLGHASVSFTLDTYGHVMPGQQADAAAAVAILVDGAP